MRGAGVSMVLPWLEAMGMNATSLTNAGSLNPAEIPRRAYFANLGFLQLSSAVPQDTGKEFTPSYWLSPWQKYKQDLTILSGMRLFAGGHWNEMALLTGKNATYNNFRLPSVDQQIADYYRGKTRFASLVAGLSGGATGRLSWTKNKTPVEPINSPKKLFDMLFLMQDKQAREANHARLQQKASVVDMVKGQADQLKARLGRDDRDTLNQYLASVYEVEEKIRLETRFVDMPRRTPQECWAVLGRELDFSQSGPETRALTNDDGKSMRTYLELMFDVIVLALWSDSTRVVSHDPHGTSDVQFQARTKSPHSHHALSHAGGGEDGKAWYAEEDKIYMEMYEHFIGQLKAIKEGDGTLLDHTITAWSCTAAETGHQRTDIPVLLCGGAGLGLKHQGHLIKKDKKVGSVWETVIQCIGMPRPRDFQGGETDGVLNELL